MLVRCPVVHWAGVAFLDFVDLRKNYLAYSDIPDGKKEPVANDKPSFTFKESLRCQFGGYECHGPKFGSVLVQVSLEVAQITALHKLVVRADYCWTQTYF